MRRPLALIVVVALVLALAPTAAAGRAGADAPADPAAGEPTEVLVKPAGGGLLGLADVDVSALPGVDEVVGVIDGIDVHIVSVAPGTAEEVAATLDALPVVAYAEPNRALPLLDAPDDPHLADQGALERIDAVAAWDAYRDARGQGDAFPATGGATIAVIDSGVDQLHPELGNKIVACQSWLTGLGVALPVCQDNNVHGTHVAGIAAATADDARGIAGVGFDAEIMALQACTLTCALADVAQALLFATENGADVVSMSFGSPDPSRTLADAVSAVDRAEVLQVAAAGNNGAAVNFPAAYDEVIAVSATDQDDALAAFSSRGPEIDVAAPGVGVLSTLPTGLLYGELSGTSQAAPHVAGVAALLIALGADADEARQAITAGADDVGLTASEQGAGRLNAADSVGIVAGG